MDKIKVALEEVSKKHKVGKIPCGTVHTFQGAESKIVIFSTVYGRQEGWKFIKENDNLINVAVSRAKDYFSPLAKDQLEAVQIMRMIRIKMWLNSC